MSCHGAVVKEALIAGGQSLPGAEVVEIELQGVLVLPAGSQLGLGLLPLPAAVVQLLLDALHGFRRGTGGFREGHGTEAALPQQVGHILLGGLVADQQHIALLPVLADLNELRRELLGGELGPQALQVHRRGEHAGAEDHMGTLLQLHGHVQVQPGGQAVLFGQKTALVRVHPGQGVQPGVDAARRPAAGPQGIRPQQLLLRHLTMCRVFFPEIRSIFPV